MIALPQLAALLVLAVCDAPMAPVEAVVQASQAPETTILLRLVRFAPGEGPVQVSSGVPLPPGLLREADLDHVAIELDGAPIPMHVSALAGRHPDGTLRSVLIQFRYPIRPGAGFPAMLEIGPDVTRPKPDPARVEPTTSVAAPLPDAVALPDEPQYLATTGIVGEFRPAPSTLSPAWENNFRTYGDPKWDSMESEYGTATLDNNRITTYNYYDRALIHYAWWARTGDVEYWKRAAYYLLPYRDRYLKPNDYRVQPHNVQIEGLEVHHLLTGDPESLRGVRLMAESLGDIWMGHIADTNSIYTEGRIQARALDALVTAARLGITSRDFAALARRALNEILGTQSADGAYRFRVTCGHQLNYMTGLVNEVFIKYHESFEPDPRIPVAIRKSLDFLWTTQWLAGDGAFKYVSGPCQGVGGPTPAPDLNLLIANGFAWYARHSGEASYRTRGDQIFREGVQRAWLTGQKQFNENYRSSFHYEAYRR